MAGELVCCLFCGRDTRSKSQACHRCEGRKAFGHPDSHHKAVCRAAPPSVCDLCGREFRGDRMYCDECRGVNGERSYHGDNYGDDE